MKVALIHDHLAQDGGAEKVLKVLTEVYPQAHIYTLLYDKKNVVNYKDRKIFSSIIQRLPGGVKHYQWYLYLMPIAVEFFDLDGYDLVISDTSSFAKGVITGPNTPHICYCHTPTRYLWSDTHTYIKELKYNKYFKKLISLVLNRIRLWDRVAADRVDHYIANSKTVQARIKKYYRRDSEVIYPPVEVDKFRVSDLSQQTPEEQYFLIGCRFAPYKRVDIVIEAFRDILVERKLKIFGDGVDRKRLERIAQGARNIEFLGRVSEEEKVKLYSGAQAFINPQEEDFGITAVESMASGRPVIAYQKGGACETVQAGKTGIFFKEQTKTSIAQAVNDYYQQSFDPHYIRSWALNFSESNFVQQLKHFIDEKLKADQTKKSNYED